MKGTGMCKYQGCGSGFIQYGSESNILAQYESGSTKSLTPDPMRIRPTTDLFVIN
jgi:hypothetical protein